MNDIDELYNRRTELMNKLNAGKFEALAWLALIRDMHEAGLLSSADDLRRRYAHYVNR